MAYKIVGVKDETVRIIVLKESDWSIERNTVSSGVGAYAIEDLSPGNKLIFAETNSGEIIGYGAVVPKTYTPVDRAVFGGGIIGNYQVTLDFINMNSTGASYDFGDLTSERSNPAACSNGINQRGVFGSGAYFDGGELASDVIDYITITTQSNASSFGTMYATRRTPAGCSNGTNERGLIGGGEIGNTYIDYITINSAASGQDFGDLSEGRGHLASCSNTTNERGVWAGGTGYTGTIDYVTINSTPGAITASDFGDLSTVGEPGWRTEVCGTSNGTNERGVFCGGDYGYNVDVIDYITINSTGNATDFGNLVTATTRGAATSSKTNERAVFGGGDDGSTTDTIDYFTINSIGNASLFGSLTQARIEADAVSNS